MPLWVSRIQCYCGYFVSPKFLTLSTLCVQIFYWEYFVSILWVQNIFSWVFCGSQFFSRRYFLCPRFFLVGVSQVQNFLSCVISLFSVDGRMRKSSIELYLKIYSKSISIIVNSAYIRKVPFPLNYLCHYAVLVCTSCSFNHLSLHSQ